MDDAAAGKAERRKASPRRRKRAALDVRSVCIRRTQNSADKQSQRSTVAQDAVSGEAADRARICIGLIVQDVAPDCRRPTMWSALHSSPKTSAVKRYTVAPRSQASGRKAGLDAGLAQELFGPPAARSPPAAGAGPGAVPARRRGRARRSSSRPGRLRIGSMRSSGPRTEISMVTSGELGWRSRRKARILARGIGRAARDLGGEVAASTRACRGSRAACPRASASRKRRRRGQSTARRQAGSRAAGTRAATDRARRSTSASTLPHQSASNVPSAAAR